MSQNKFVLRQVGDTSQPAWAADSQRPENLPQGPELVSLLSLRGALRHDSAGPEGP